MSNNNLSAKDEALLVLEYLENERMSNTFLNFLDENKHLHELRSRLYANYDNPQQINNNDDDSEVNEFQTFFNLSKKLVSQLNDQPATFLSTKSSNDLFFDDDFLNDLISYTPPMDCQQDLSDTPLINHENQHMNSIEQLFAIEHDTPSHQTVHGTSDTSSNQTVHCTSDTPSRLTSYTKCIVVTQDFLQTMYNQQSTVTNNNNNNSNSIHKPKRRRRRLKVGKENYSQQRKIMPRTSPEHR
ncbi:unnamed protein product [Adineta steineri]|uniref:Uncharacterized protein n=1 Tax=Adineta steineri TaxID=433720 RepID=A0A819QSL4_9BILA|nr:unnamed protein product [Adineta steineri]CAF4029671.1 unnamed protein product [Adineta steineri]